MRRFIWLLTLIGYLFSGVGMAHADVNSNMNDFWNSSLTMSNGRGPTSYQGQQAGYYTLGNYSLRTPVQNTQLYSFQMPSVKGGCGGIDMFGGSFSFINSDQLVALFKNIAQNAVGLLFQMAVKTLSELLGNEVEHMFDLLNSHNLGELNSCAMAQTAINDVVNWMPQSTLKNCISLGLASSQFTDEASARAACGFGGQAEGVVAGASGAAATQVPTNRNIAWEAINKDPIFQNDHQTAELMMTLTGTFSVVVTPPANGSSPPTVNVNPTAPQGDSDSYIDALLNGSTSIMVHHCHEYTQCLVFDPYGETVSVSGLTSQVDALVQGIVQQIVARQPLTAAQINLLGLSTVPLYKIASVEVAQNGLTAGQDMSAYSQAIAQDVLIGWIKSNLSRVQEQALSSYGLSPGDQENWNHNLEHVVDSLDKREVVASEHILAVQALIDRTNAMEKTIAADTSSRLATAILFAQNQRPE